MTEYIEREALEVALNHRLSFLMAENSEYDHYTSGYEEAVDTVENFPSTADVAPVVHGRFVHDGPRLADYVDWWHCSNCGRQAAGVETRFAYCPNCGARMDGGDNDDKSRDT